MTKHDGQISGRSRDVTTIFNTTLSGWCSSIYIYSIGRGSPLLVAHQPGGVYVYWSFCRCCGYVVLVPRRHCRDDCYYFAISLSLCFCIRQAVIRKRLDIYWKSNVPGPIHTYIDIGYCFISFVKKKLGRINFSLIKEALFS